MGENALAIVPYNEKDAVYGVYRIDLKTLRHTQLAECPLFGTNYTTHLDFADDALYWAGCEETTMDIIVTKAENGLALEILLVPMRDFSYAPNAAAPSPALPTDGCISPLPTPTASSTSAISAYLCPNKIAAAWKGGSLA